MNTVTLHEKRSAYDMKVIGNLSLDEQIMDAIHRAGRQPNEIQFSTAFAMDRGSMGLTQTLITSALLIWRDDVR